MKFKVNESINHYGKNKDMTSYYNEFMNYNEDVYERTDTMVGYLETFLTVLNGLDDESLNKKDVAEALNHIDDVLDDLSEALYSFDEARLFGH